MIHPDTAVRFIAPAVGRGVIATAPIPQGTITWVRDPLDAGWPVEDVMGWPDVYWAVLYRTCLLIDGTVVQPWDHARLVNHSCEPNCAGTRFGFEVALVDINPGEQMTNDYDGFALPGDPPFACECGSPACRGLDVYRASHEVRSRLEVRVGEALKHTLLLPQPLLDLVPPDRLTAALDALTLQPEPFSLV